MSKVLSRKETESLLKELEKKLLDPSLYKDVGVYIGRGNETAFRVYTAPAQDRYVLIDAYGRANNSLHGCIMGKYNSSIFRLIDAAAFFGSIDQKTRQDLYLAIDAHDKASAKESELARLKELASNLGYSLKKDENV